MNPSGELEAQAPRPVSRIRSVCGSRHVEKVVPPGLVDVADHGEGELAGRGRYGLRLISTGKVLPSLRSPTSRAPAPIGRVSGAWA
jgi:hypothetical protein